MSYIEHQGQKYPIPEGSDAKGTFESLKAVLPELANAELKKTGDHYEAKVNYGRKG